MLVLKTLMKGINLYLRIVQIVMMTQMLSLTVSYQLSQLNSVTLNVSAEQMPILLWQNSTCYYSLTKINNLTHQLRRHSNPSDSMLPLLITNLSSTFLPTIELYDPLLVMSLTFEEDLLPHSRLFYINKLNFSDHRMVVLDYNILVIQKIKKNGFVLILDSSSRLHFLTVNLQANVSGLLQVALLNDWSQAADATILKSKSQGYILFYQRELQFLEMASFNYTVSYLSPGFVSLTNFSFTADYQSACFEAQKFLVVHTSDQKLHFYNLSSSIWQEAYDIGINSSFHCYYDLLTNAVILKEASSNGTVFWTFSRDSNSIIESTEVTNFSSFSVFPSVFTLIDESTSSVSIAVFQYSTCTHSYFYEPSNFTCFQCPGRCQTCNSTQYCYDCFSNNNFIDNYCCGLNEYYIYVPDAKKCHACPTGCLTCDSQTYCKTCNTNFSLAANNLCYVDDPASLTLFLDGSLSSLLNNQGMRFVNSVPSSRGILKPIFASLLSFDQISLYQYHQRDYGQYMRLLFQSIQQIENQKWSSLDGVLTDNILTMAGADVSRWIADIDIKRNYSSPYFLQANQRGEGFFAVSWSYWSTTLLATLIIFVTCRLLFFLFFKHRWSIYLRSYSFWPFYLLLIMDGNLQQLIFFLASNFRLAFSQNFSQKTYLMLSWIFFGSLLLFSFAFFLLIFNSYRKSMKYFTENVRCNIYCLVYLTIQFGVKNCLMGLIHNLFRQRAMYRIQLGLLLTVEACVFINYVYFISSKLFFYRLKVWSCVFTSIIKMSFIVLLFLRIEFASDEIVSNLNDSLLAEVVLLYVQLIYVGIIINISITIKQIIGGIISALSKIRREDARNTMIENVIKVRQPLRMRVSIISKLSKFEEPSKQIRIKKDRSLFYVNRNIQNHDLISVSLS